MGKTNFENLIVENVVMPWGNESSINGGKARRECLLIIRMMIWADAED